MTEEEAMDTLRAVQQPLYDAWKALGRPRMYLMGDGGTTLLVITSPEWHEEAAASWSLVDADLAMRGSQ